MNTYWTGCSKPCSFYITHLAFSTSFTSAPAGRYFDLSIEDLTNNVMLFYIERAQGSLHNSRIKQNNGLADLPNAL
ncbi:hypothetical protein AAG747_25330 [Rapidithrix thailandica]|uniref:Uncharacterized protein n=1 Tax=Rapidithrix thailandica TaxID=413964 RepID=A0AAW9SFC5_9BACT